MFEYIKIGSITTAQRAASALRSAGVNAVIKRIENPQKGDGCGYMVGVDSKKLYKAQNVLRQRGIKTLGVYSDGIS